MKAEFKHTSFAFLWVWVLFFIAVPSWAGISFTSNQMDIYIPPACNHVPVSIPYSPSAAFDESLITVSSDSGWVVPSVNTASNTIDLAFATETMIASYTATLSVDDGDKVTELFVHLNVNPLNIYRLIDDPLRAKMYGIQRNGIYNGSIVAFDPVKESLIACMTVGESPTDFVINNDSSELLVINSVGQSITVIDLVSFSIKETIPLPIYSAWGSAGETTANIDLGADDIIYYSDGSWGPVLHVYKRSTGTVLQSIIFDGSSPSNGTGFMDFAVTGDKKRMVAMPQYGWSAGAHYPTIGQYTINANGTIAFVKQTTLSGFAREPFEAPVLIRDDKQIAIMKTVAASTADTDKLDREFPSAVWSMNPNGSVVATADKLYNYNTSAELYTIPGGTTGGSGYIDTKAQAFTSDFTRFVYFNASDQTLNVVNLVNEIGLDQLGRSLSPADGAVVNSPDMLTWMGLAGVDQYDLYLGTDEALVAAADTSSLFYLGRVTGTSLALAQALINGTDYFWRIDAVTLLGPEKGAVYSFTVSDIALDIAEVDAQTVEGHTDYQVKLQLSSEQPGVFWSASATDTWVTFSESTGTTPSTLTVHLDAHMLSTGLYNSTITLSSEAGELEIPVQFQVDPLSITHIQSDRNSVIAYAISEATNSVIAQAYLLEIDTAEEKIQRVIPVGSSVTDFTISYPDQLIYITNWKSGNLLVIDKNTFENIKSIAFKPAATTGSSEGDVYRVAAGVSQRLVVEEEDQWINISLFNTGTKKTLDTGYVREGGGAFDPSGRYYYHGENNSSGAKIIKFDTAGDVFTQIAAIRPPEISSSYGSRTVVISEDGSRIFWAGVALNENLQTEWAVGETVYSTSADGRYAICQTAIYDMNLRRQVLELPSPTSVSGYNSTTEKLIIQAGNSLEYFSLATPISMPTPVLSASNPSSNSIDLSWTDHSLEMTFVIQQRLAGADTWTDIKSTHANVTHWQAVGLQPESTYEFRVRASSSDYNSSWSNIASATTTELINHAPQGKDAIYPVHWQGQSWLNLMGTDIDGDTLVFEIVQAPDVGELIVLDETAGKVSYENNSSSATNTYFTYRISDGHDFSGIYRVDIEMTNTRPEAPSFHFISYSSLSFSTIIVAHDADADHLTYELLSNVSTGDLSLTQEGLLTYNATETASHIITVPYRVSDGRAWSAVGEIRLQVYGVLLDYSPVYLSEFSADQYAGTAPQSTNFSSAALGGSGYYDYLWDFGDGNTSTEQNPNHTFLSAGKYTVTLTVTDQTDSANIASGELKVLVLSEPNELSVDFTVSADEQKRLAVFNIKIQGDEPPYHLEIDYGDGNTETTTISTDTHAFEHSYAELGSYNVSVIVKSQSGASAKRLSIASGSLTLADASNDSSDTETGSTSLFVLLMLCLIAWYRKPQKS